MTAPGARHKDNLGFAQLVARRPDALRIVLVRHGQTDWNLRHRFLGATDIPVNGEGARQEERFAAGVSRRFDAVYSSPLGRAQSLAHRLAPPTPVTVDAFREMSQGILEGLTVAEAERAAPGLVDAWNADPVNTRIPEAETIDETHRRARCAVDRVIAAHARGECVAIVTHQLVIAALCAEVASAGLCRWRDYRCPNGGAAVLSWDGKRLRLLATRVQP